MNDLSEWERYGEYSYLPCGTLNSIKLKFFRKLSMGSYPHIVNFAITWKCNSKCRMCNIWRDADETEIPPEKVERIFSDKIFRKTKLVKLTGGEPTLHPQLPEIIRLISGLLPESRIAINTNAYPFERMKKVADECVRIRDDLIFSIGLDGIGDIHNHMRGRKCFQEVMKTVNYFEDLRRSKKVLFRFSFTITPWNFRDLPGVVEFARERETYVGFRVMHLDKLYRNESLKIKDGFINEFKHLLEELGNNYFKKHIGDRERNVRCFAFINSVFIDPYGYFHPCLYRDRIGEGELSKLWKGEEGKRIRNDIKNCSKCWSDCQTLPNIIAEFGEFR
ncbi:MAG TPA: radical SAM protein [Archaeoglobaceae archaeon]|nr:radical SAM protein [Archaeoglobaceae archaeon]